jgi:hypothetical protein
LLATVRFYWAYANAHFTNQFKEIEMATLAYRFAVETILLILMTALTGPSAYAQVSGGGDVPKAANGLGQSMPSTADLASDPAWKIYEFERDGIRYLQINDGYNSARAAIGQIGSTAWVLPIGRDADRVSIQSGVQAAVDGRVVYRDNKVEVIHYLQSNQDGWIIRPVEASH